MICKWCGVQINAGEVRCRSCGRENPPMSDCGGFYDLVPGARGGGAAPRQEVRIDLTGVQNDMKHYANRSGNSLRILTLLTVLGFLLVSILLIVTSCQVSDLQEQVTELAEMLSQEQPTETEEPDPAQSDPTEPSTEPSMEPSTEPTQTTEESELEGMDAKEEQTPEATPEQNTEEVPEDNSEDTHEQEPEETPEQTPEQTP